MPDWFPIMHASRILGVPPWELMKQPYYWVDIANMYDYALKSAGAE